MPGNHLIFFYKPYLRNFLADPSLFMEIFDRFLSDSPYLRNFPADPSLFKEFWWSRHGVFLAGPPYLMNFLADPSLFMEIFDRFLSDSPF